MRAHVQLPRADLKCALLLLLPLALSCYRNPRERNEIAFADPVAQVQDSLESALDLVDHLASSYDLKNYLIGWDSTEILLGSEHLERPESLLSQSNVRLTGMPLETRRRFWDVVIFLQKNHISGCFKDISTGRWLFQYRVVRREDDDDRNIAIATNEFAESLIRRDYKVLDQRGRTLLVTWKKSRIR